MSLYNPNVPTGTIELDEDYINLQNNFQQLSTSFQVNHLPLENSSTSNGAHTFVEMRNQAAIPPALKAQEGTIYTKIVNAVSEMFYTPDNSTNEYQLTRTSGANIATFGTNTVYAVNRTGGWTFLPGGLLFQYGSFSPTTAADTVTFPVPFTTQVYNIELTQVMSNNSTVRLAVKSGSVTLLQFITEATASAGLVSFYWQAIGK